MRACQAVWDVLCFQEGTVLLLPRPACFGVLGQLLSRCGVFLLAAAVHFIVLAGCRPVGAGRELRMAAGVTPVEGACASNIMIARCHQIAEDTYHWRKGQAAHLYMCLEMRLRSSTGAPIFSILICTSEIMPSIQACGTTSSVCL